MSFFIFDKSGPKFRTTGNKILHHQILNQGNAIIGAFILFKLKNLYKNLLINYELIYKNK